MGKSRPTTWSRFVEANSKASVTEKISLWAGPHEKLCGDCGIVTPYKDRCSVCGGYVSGLKNKWMDNANTNSNTK